MNVTVRLSTAGLGVIFYSPYGVQDIAEGADYLTTHFVAPPDVSRHVLAGTIATFCTGTGGDFDLHLTDDVLDHAAVHAADFKLRLALQVWGGRVCFRDLYDLLDWTADCPAEQCVAFDDGFYRVTVYSSAPPSGILGDDQRIDLHFERTLSLPRLAWAGVPQLCN